MIDQVAKWVKKYEFGQAPFSGRSGLITMASAIPLLGDSDGVVNDCTTSVILEGWKMARVHECYAVWLTGYTEAEVFYTKAEADVFFETNKEKVHRYCYEELVMRYQNQTTTFEVKSETQLYPSPG